MRSWTLLAPISLIAISAPGHAADCQPAFLGGDQSVVVDGVEVEPGGRATADFDIRVQNAAGPGGGGSAGAGGGPCEATIRIARIGGSADPDFPSYVLRAPGNGRIEVLPDPASGGTADSDIFIANAPPGTNGRNVPLRLRVTTEWGSRAGTYVEQLVLLLVDRNGQVVDRSNLTITIVIPSAVSLRLIGAVIGDGTSGPARVDLGNLSSTAVTRSQPFAAHILSTAPYVVRFSSTNLGNLLHEQGREQVPYRLFFEGALVDLAGSNEFPYLEPSPRRGDRRPMRIAVPPVTALAGNYSDRITVTVTAM